METKKRKVLAGTVAALAVVGGGGAYAATKALTPAEESKAVIDDAAKQLGVSSSKLDSALRKAFSNRIDAAVASGRISKAEGDELKARLQAGPLPLFFGGEGRGHHGGGHFGAHLDAAASYLGLTAAALRTELDGGKTLAQVATAHDKSVDGLVQALVDSERKQLAAAVAAGRLTKAQEQQLLQGAKARMTDLVNGVRLGRDRDGGPPMFFRHGAGRGAPSAPSFQGFDSPAA